MMRKVTKSGGIIAEAVALVALSAGVPALASAAEMGEIEEVVVTARKREESAQEVPISLTALSGKDVLDQAALRIQDIAQLIPNVVFLFPENNGLTNFTVRGVQASINTRPSGFDTSVAMYVDGVVRGRPTEFNQELIDIERVEFLRGPQGTLFGRNSIAGAISVTTRLPGDEFAADVDLLYGSYDHFQASAFLSVPIVEGKAAMSASAYSSTRDGIIDNEFSGEEIYDKDSAGGRFKLLFTPSEDLTIMFALDGVTDEATGPAPQAIDGPLALTGTHRTNINLPANTTRDIWGTQLNIDYDTSIGATFTSITGYREIESARTTDTDGTPADNVATFLSSDYEQFSQEFRLTSSGDSNFQYVVGAYYLNLKTTDSITAAVFGGFFNPTVGGTVETEDFALFANLDYAVSETVTLNGGLRLLSEKRTLSYEQNGDFVAPDLPFEVDKQKYEEALPTLGVRWQANDKAMLYLTVSRGFKGGGWNNDAITSGVITSFSQLAFEPEFATSYEIGAKTSWMENRLIANLALFYLDYTDIQQRQIVDIPFGDGTIPQNIVTNAASAESVGFEFELSARPTDNFSLNLGIGYADATFTDYLSGPVDDPATIDYSGNSLGFSPKWTTSLSANYSYPITSNVLLVVAADYVYRSSFYQDPLNLVENDSVGVVNARIGLADAANGKWEFYLWGKNVFDKEYVVFQGGYGFFVPLGNTVFWGDPAQFGVRAAFHF